MERREVLKSVVALTLAAAAGSVTAAQHTHHHHGTHPHSQLIGTVGTCIEKGQICIAHCLTLLGEGDKDIAACAKSVQQMLAFCSALQQLASQESPYLRETALIAAKACKDCEAECDKHADKHIACKDCREACADCRKECEALTA
jgi:Cys-rich four helix bundle protein (predicted Tat secretion target)